MDRLVQQFRLPLTTDLPPRYNIAPSQQVAVVRRDPLSGERRLALVRWGLVPSWAEDPAIGNRMINARAETVAVKPAFRAAYRHRRCLIPADGFYEWKTAGGRKQPYFIHLPDDRSFAFAGLWESWSGHGDVQRPTPLETCTIITTQACASLRRLHDRMPVILRDDDYAAWLGEEETAPEHLAGLLAPFAAETLTAEPVSTRVNHPRHDDPQCLAPPESLL